MFTPLSVPPGIARGATSRTLPGRWNDGNLVRWRGGVLTPVGGWLRQTETPLASIPRTLVAWRDATDARYLGVGCDSHWYVIQGDVTTDVTPAGFVPADSNTLVGGYGNDLYGAQNYGDARESPLPAGFFRANTVSMDTFGNVLLFSSLSDGKLYKWDPAVGGVATSVDTAPTSIRGMLVNKERTVMAIGGNGTPRRLNWSSRESYTDWTTTNTNTAGFLDLDSSGYLLAMATVREGTLIWGDNDLFLARFIGAPYYYSADPIASNLTLMSPASIATADGKAFWMTRAGFMMYDGGYVKPISCDIADFIFSDIDPIWGRTRTCGFVHGAYPEIWWFYPSVGSMENDSYVFFDYETGYWSKGKLARSCGLPPLNDQYPIMGGVDGHIWTHENGDAFNSLGAGDIFVESGALHPIPGKLITALRVFPDSEDGPLCTELEFVTRMTPEGPETIYGPYVARPDGWMDVRFTCRQLQVRIRQRCAGHWTVGEPEIDLRVSSGR